MGIVFTLLAMASMIVQTVVLLRTVYWTVLPSPLPLILRGINSIEKLYENVFLYFQQYGLIRLLSIL